MECVLVFLGRVGEEVTRWLWFETATKHFQNTSSAASTASTASTVSPAHAEHPATENPQATAARTARTAWLGDLLARPNSAV